MMLHQKVSVSLSFTFGMSFHEISFIYTDILNQSKSVNRVMNGNLDVEEI